MSKSLILLTTCDVDPDTETFGGFGYNVRNKFKWNCIVNGIPNIKEMTADLKDDYGGPLRFCWFVRSDSQIFETYGNQWLPDDVLSVIKNLSIDKDEIGWHPHLWRWNDTEGLYSKELEDNEWRTECLEIGAEVIKREFPVKSVRMGFNHHDNFTVNIIEKLGLINDLSPIPGLSEKFKPECKERNEIFAFNWQGSPNTPYYPSLKDYRYPTRYKNEAFNILMIPTTIIDTPTFYKFHRIIRRKHVFNTLPISITKHPSLISYGLKKWFKVNSTKQNNYLTTSFHADELLGEGKLFSAMNLVQNLNSIIKLAHNYNMSIHYMTAEEAGDMARKEIKLT